MIGKLMAGLALMAVVGSGSAQASVVLYSTRTAFNAAGTIVENNDFQGYSGSQGSVFTLGSVTYTAGDNAVLDPSFGLGNSNFNILANGLGGPLSAQINNGPYNLFAFDAGTLNNADTTLSLTLNTNQGTYTNLPLSPIADVSTGMTFFGFGTTGSGEYFTDFTLDGIAPAITNVSLGTATNSVPEPGTYLLLCISLGVVGVARAKRTAQKNEAFTVEGR